MVVDVQDDVLRVQLERLLVKFDRKIAKSIFFLTHSTVGFNSSFYIIEYYLLYL